MSSCQAPPTLPAAAGYFDVGNFQRKVSTRNQDAQTWFNRGLSWAYGFNHEEASRCFAQVVAHDPSCAMGYWGLAYSSGPNYNKKWTSFDPVDLKLTWETCYSWTQKASSFTAGISSVEKALIEAMGARFPSPEPLVDLSTSVWGYVDAMRKAYWEYGHDDLDVAALAADALMSTNPWHLFKQVDGEPDLTTPVLEVKYILEKALQKKASESHLGLLHFYIHLMELSTTPQAALEAANSLRFLAPDVGHAHHMPSHIDVLVGDYRTAVATNLKATAADDRYFDIHGACNFYSLYRLHDYHSLIFAAMMSGQSRVALEAVHRMEATLPDELLMIECPPMVNWMEFFKSNRIHVLIRFGMWDELKVLPLPQNQDLYRSTTAMTHYGRALAFAATGDVENGDKERSLYRLAAERVPSSRLIHPNKVVDVLAVASPMLDGELEYRRGNIDLAFSRLRDAMAQEDKLLYAEPWPWMVPTRHAFAALSLEQGLISQAMKAYAQDLGLDPSLARTHQHHKNMWSLHGYHECLVAMGRNEEAESIREQLDEATADADIVLTSSCFCRLDTKQEFLCPKVKTEKACCVEKCAGDR